MKRNFNVIQINGFRGILLAISVVTCLIAGFVIFPGIIMKSLWNVVSGYFGLMPAISVTQGVLLWGILAFGYFVFRKNHFLIEFKSTNDLSNEEMEEVMQRIRLQRQAEIFSKAIMKAKELELEKDESLDKKESDPEEVKNNIDI